MHKDVRQNLKVSFDPPADNGVRDYLQSVLELEAVEPTLLQQRSCQHDCGDELQRRKQERRKRMADNLAASRIEDGVVVELEHPFQFGCCSSREESIAKVIAYIEDVLLPGPPDVPACSRWRKLCPAFFLLGQGMCFPLFS